MNESMKNITQEENEVEIDLLELFYYLKSKWKWLTIAFVLGAVLFAVGTKLFITPLYQASSKVYMVSASSDSMVDLTDLNIGTSLSQDYIELLQVRPLLEDVINDLELEYTPEQLLSMLSISVKGNTRMIQITATNPDPVEAADIANCMAKMAVTYVPEVMETATPNIAEKAVVPEHKSSPSLAKNTAIGALLFTLLTAGFFVILMLLDDTFKSAEDVEKALGVMPLTIIPEGEMNTIDDKAEKKILEEKKQKAKKKKKQQAKNQKKEQ